MENKSEDMAKFKFVAKYTVSEIMEGDYKELWDRVVKYEEKLTCLQKSVLVVLPQSKKQVADNTDCLQRYLQEKSAYLFAHNVWERLYELCDRLTDFPDNSSDARDVEDQLNAFLGKLDDIEFEGLLPDQHADLNDFYKVVSSISYDLIGVVSNWSLRDILYSGYEAPGLLDDTMQDVIPMVPSVGRIENDDTPKRIY